MRSKTKTHKGLANIAQLGGAEPRHARTNTIYELDVPNSDPPLKTSDHSRMSAIYTDFYRNLYGPKTTYTEDQDKLLNAVTRRLQPSDTDHSAAFF